MHTERAGPNTDLQKQNLQKPESWDTEVESSS